MVGLPYLYNTLGQLVKEACKNAGTVEVDTNKLDAGDDYNLNN